MDAAEPSAGPGDAAGVEGTAPAAPDGASGLARAEGVGAAGLAPATPVPLVPLATDARALDRRFTWAAPGLWAMLAIHGGALLALHPAARPTPALLALAAGLFVARAFCVSAGYHRYFSHRAYKTSRPVQLLLAFVGGMAVLRGPLWWAAHHRQHHARSDQEGDPHSPRRGLLWAHLTWFMARGNQPTRRELIKDFARYPELRFLDRHEWVPVLALIALCLAVGGFPGWVWGANVSTVLLCHSVFSINSISHRWGRRRYDVLDDSTNNFAVGLWAFGEGWHNNHHRWPARARLGERWWEVDLSWYGLWVLEKLGLVWDVRR